MGYIVLLSPYFVFLRQDKVRRECLLPLKLNYPSSVSAVLPIEIIALKATFCYTKLRENIMELHNAPDSSLSYTAKSASPLAVPIFCNK